MSDLVNFPKAKQQYDKSCWACASRMIINYYSKEVMYSSDKKLAEHVRLTANSYQSASNVLHGLGYKNEADDQAVPTLTEIKKAIDAGTPLLACVGAEEPIETNGKIERDLNFRGGHWVVIVGVDVAKKELHVFDPDSGIVENVTRGKLYKNGQYWKNTSYVDKKLIKKRKFSSI